MRIAELDVHGSPEAASRALGIAFPPQLARAVPTRRMEFLAGRLCARRALQAAGYTGTAELPINARRGPVWPAGFVGSIAHGAETAWAVVASQRHYRALGIDLERLVTPAAAAELSASVLLHSESALARAANLGFEQFLGLAFSAKETLYKCLNPLTGAAFDFLDVEIVELSPGTGALRVALRTDLSPDVRAGEQFVVRFRIGSEIHTSTSIAA
ncbi:MAG: 4'-phosphopantetheinyl transferase superfamily protein [Proteobacteria bacterium]|nr:4'-phosphopantetheinyl transferase superfamily protein [Pseudomonadota bacterium]